jgi:hypothetical protein
MQAWKRPPIMFPIMDGLPAGRDSIISLVYGGYFISLSLASPIELVPHRTPFAVRVHNSHRSGRPVRARVSRVRRKKVSAAPAYVGRRESYSKQATGTAVPWMLDACIPTQYSIQLNCYGGNGGTHVGMGHMALPASVHHTALSTSVAKVLCG